MRFTWNSGRAIKVLNRHSTNMKNVDWLRLTSSNRIIQCTEHLKIPHTRKFSKLGRESGRAFHIFELSLFFHFSLFKMREHGIQSREIGRRSTEKPICNSHSPYFESVRIVDCYAAFLVFCYGIAAALIFLCIESIWFKCKPKSQNFRLFNRK